MYVVGFIIAAIITLFVVIITKYIAYRNSKVHYSKWEFDCEEMPIFTSVDGEEFFQNIITYRRYDRFVNKWEFKKVVDPSPRPIKEGNLNVKYWRMALAKN